MFALPLARCPRTRELGSAPPNRRAAALRQKTPPVNPSGPPLWVWLSRIWGDWRSALAIVRPETVVAWHRAGVRLFWTWKVRRGQPGRPTIAREVRDLIPERGDDDQNHGPNLTETRGVRSVSNSFILRLPGVLTRDSSPKRPSEPRPNGVHSEEGEVVKKTRSLCCTCVCILHSSVNLLVIRANSCGRNILELG